MTSSSSPSLAATLTHENRSKDEKNAEETLAPSQVANEFNICLGKKIEAASIAEKFKIDALSKELGFERGQCREKERRREKG